jgi:Type II restriction endonuclease EcoO109I
MHSLNLEVVREYVEQNISDFHKRKLESLDRLRLKDVLRKKNPYLFRAKNLLSANDVVQAIVNAHISSNEETIFGNWLEELAIFINQQTFGGRKSGMPSIDLEFDNDNIRYIVAIKSGPNWGNSGQIKNLVRDFTAARRTLRTSNAKINVVAVNGCCYGKFSTTHFF